MKIVCEGLKVDMSEVKENLKNLVVQVLFNYFGGQKVKITRSKLEEIVRSVYTAGVVSACDEILRKYGSDKELTKDDLAAEMHVLKMNAWNDLAKINPNLKKVGIEEAMDPDVAYSKVYKNVTLAKNFEKAMNSVHKG